MWIPVVGTWGVHWFDETPDKALLIDADALRVCMCPLCIINRL